MITCCEKPVKNIKEDTWTGIAWCKDLKLFIVVCDQQANKKKEDLLLVSSDGINWTKPDCNTWAKLDNIYANMLRKI